MKKKILSILLSVAMVAGLFPTAAYAGTGEKTTAKTIQSGTTGISDPEKNGGTADTFYTPSSYIYFGVNSSDSNAPIKWRVLDADKANDGTTAGMFLMSEYILGTDVNFSNEKKNVYQGSNAQSQVRAFAGNANNFSATEQSLMVGVAKKDPVSAYFNENGWSYYGDTSASGSLTTSDKMFLMSVDELYKYVGNYDGASTLVGTDTSGTTKVWYTRTSCYDYKTKVGGVTKNGSVNEVGVTGGNIRPAFNLDTSKVLFTSAATGGKVDALDTSLSAVSNYTGKEWKLTLLDSSRTFTATISTADSASNTYTVNYDNANVGENEYVSAVIKDSNGSITHYGRLVKPTRASGTVTINLSGIDMTGKTLYLFSEQYNGGDDDDTKLTDYASSLVPITLSSCPGMPSNMQATPGCGEATITWTAPADGGSPITSYYYQIIGNGGYVSTGNANTSLKLDNLVNGTTYTVRIYASNGRNMDGDGNVVRVTPGHVWSENYQHNQWFHWRECSICGEEDGTITTCSDQDSDHKCDVCGNKTSDHYGGIATCTSKATCQVCGKTYGEFADHSLTHYPATEASVKAAGNIEYWYCSVCHKYFSDEACENQITGSVTISGDKDMVAARAVVEKILAIGTVSYTDACKNRIDAARSAYDALTKAQKDKISYDEYYKVLVDAEKAYADMKTTVDNAENKGTCLDKDYKDVPVITGYVWDITSLANENKNAVDVSIENDDKLTELLGDNVDSTSGVNVWLESTDVTELVNSEDSATFEAKKSDYTIGSYIDLSMYAKESSKEATKITNLNGKLQVSISIPESLRKDNRSYEIIRLHEGETEATVLQGTYDKSTYTFTFETDRFSLYAIAYKDADNSADKNNTGDNKGNNTGNTTGDKTGSITANTKTNSANAKAKTNASTAAGTPKTGDTSNVTLYVIILVAGIAVIAVIAGLYVKRKKENR